MAVSYNRIPSKRDKTREAAIIKGPTKHVITGKAILECIPQEARQEVASRRPIDKQVPNYNLNPGDCQDGGRVPDKKKLYIYIKKAQKGESLFSGYRVFIADDEKGLGIKC